MQPKSDWNFTDENYSKMFLLTGQKLHRVSLNYAPSNYCTHTNTRNIFLTTAHLTKCIRTTERLDTASSSHCCSYTVKPSHQYVFILLSVVQPGSSSTVSLSDHKGGTTQHCLLASHHGPLQTSGCTFYAKSCTFSLLGSWLISGLHRTAKAGSS